MGILPTLARKNAPIAFQKMPTVKKVELIALRKSILKVLINKIKIYCIMTHLSSADEVYKESNKVQKKELEKIKKMFANTPLSIANSNAIFNLKNFNYSFVRSGGALFGINPIRDKKKVNFKKVIIFIIAFYSFLISSSFFPELSMPNSFAISISSVIFFFVNSLICVIIKS